MDRRQHPDAAAREARYRSRLLGGLAASVLVVWAAFRFWPGFLAPPPFDPARVERPPAPVQIELIEPTVQAQPAPSTPPPAPREVLLPPVEVPDERVVEERVEQLSLDLPVLDARPGPPPAPAGPPAPPDPPAPAGPAPLVERPQRSPRVVRFAEPAYPPEARRAGVHARADVRLLVDERGRPQEPRIVSRALVGRDGREEPVASLPYGLDEAILDAALRYQFRPAEHSDRNVRSYYTIPFEVGRR